MSNNTVEKDKAVIRVFFSDGTFKCFLVTESQTANAVKFMVSKKLGLDPKELHLFGMYMLEDGSKVTELDGRPFELHVKWGPKSGEKYKFLFKRTDEPYRGAPAPGGASPAPAASGPVSPRGGQTLTSSGPSNPTTPATSAPMPINRPPSTLGAPPKAPPPTPSSPPTLGMSPASGQPHQMPYPATSPSTGYSNQEQQPEQPPQQAFSYISGPPPSQPKRTVVPPARSTGFVPSELAHQQQKPADGGVGKQQIISWVNRVVASSGKTITNLSSDLEDGVVLFTLLENLTNKKFKGWHLAPSNLMFKLDNLSLFLKTMNYFGFKITGVSPEDIFGGNENITIALLLVLLKHFGDQFNHRQSVYNMQLQPQQQQESMEAAGNVRSSAPGRPPMPSVAPHTMGAPSRPLPAPSVAPAPASAGSPKGGLSNSGNRPLPQPGAARPLPAAPKKQAVAPPTQQQSQVPQSSTPAQPEQPRSMYDPAQDYAYDHYQQSQPAAAASPASSSSPISLSPAVQSVKLQAAGQRRPRSGLISSGDKNEIFGSPSQPSAVMAGSPQQPIQQQQPQVHASSESAYTGYDTAPVQQQPQQQWQDPNAAYWAQQQYQQQYTSDPQQYQAAFGYQQPGAAATAAGWNGQTADSFYYEDTYATPEEVDLATTSDAPNASSFAAPAVLELDFSVAVPGSKEEMNRRARASTLIRNIDTNVFALEAFSDMEQILADLSMGL
eukprot:TRINITY_DN6312_c0_g1_i1.p1 TRINITY_DN6312_c0_g1~~TRINITY_DN6312_c0_g1_i1.p1  ORF type:complete len:722 (+),score=150.86 TRINITY_DN6312_c0_g1_i1:45-2210(+)